MAHINALPESAAAAFDWMAKEVTTRSKGALEMQFFGKTLIPQEIEIMNAVKSGNIQIGNPAGAAATVFPEMGALLVPYLVKDYKSAYAMLNGKIGDSLDKMWQEKYKVKALCFFDYGFRHFWTSKAPIIEPKDLRGKKIRVQQAKVFGDTINGLGGNAVPMAWGEVISAAKSGVIDGGDLPVVNMEALKIYDVSKYCSLTFHNYGPTVNVMNLEAWNALTPAQQKLMLDISREAQGRIREATESVDNFAAAKKLLEPRGMTVVEANVEAFRKIAQQKIWPAYKSQYGALWDEIENFKA
jgi:tripartite ATP-independent transporter DctP family solute receptor